MNWKKLTHLSLVLIITFAIFYVIFTKIDFCSVIEVLLHTDLKYLLIALLLMIIGVFIRAKRWQAILETMGYNCEYKECFNLIMASAPLTSITPAKSGDVIKAYYLKDRIPASKTVGSILTERIFDVLTLLSFSLIGMVFYQKYEFVSIISIILVILIVLILILYTNARLPIKGSWNEKLQNISLSLKMLAKNRKAFLAVILCSLSSWFLAVAQTLMFFYALGIHVSFLFTMANIPIAIFIGMMPVTLGGMGTRDAAIIFIFSEFTTSEKLLGVGILFSIFRYWLLSLLGIPFMQKMMNENS